MHPGSEPCNFMLPILNARETSGVVGWDRQLGLGTHGGPTSRRPRAAALSWGPLSLHTRATSDAACRAEKLLTQSLALLWQRPPTHSAAAVSRLSQPLPQACLLPSFLHTLLDTPDR